MRWSVARTLARRSRRSSVFGVASAGRERHYWRAVDRLREAEGLAQLQAVSGPADAPPEAGAEQSWFDDWSSRAKGALRKARELVDSGKRAAKDRARRIAQAVRDGASAVWKASPPGQLASASKSTLQNLADAATAIQWASIIGSGVATLALLGAVYWLWTARKG